MSIYDQRTRAGNPRNPAKALYAHWHSVLKHEWELDSDGYPMGSFQFGRDRYYGIGPYYTYHSQGSHPESEVGTKQYPHIAIGVCYGYGAGSDLIVTRRGEFRVGHGFHGYHQRNRLARNTFLDWDYHRSSYQWFVNTSHELTAKRFDGDSRLLKDWRQPVHYIRERLLIPEYVIAPYWLKLERDTNFVGGWKIAFSRMSDLPPNRWQLQDVDIPERFARYETLRVKRLAKQRDADLIASGDLVQTGRRTWIPRAEIEQRKEEQALVLAAHFDVSMPARTTPLKPLRRR